MSIKRTAASKYRFVLAYLSIAISVGCSEPAAEDVQPVTTTNATQLHKLTEDTAPTAKPWQGQTRGTVVEIFPNAIKLATPKQADGIILATSGDVQVFSGGDEIQLADLRPGDEVSVASERRGNAGDGWQSLVVQVNRLHPNHAVAEDPNDVDTLLDQPGYGVQFRATYVKSDATTITVKPSDSEGKPSLLPLDRSATVERQGKIGNTSLLKAGDDLELTTESRGNRQDGWIDVVTRINVVPRSADVD